MAKLDQSVRLSDGRRLGYNEYGSPDGEPLFYFHGSPSARVEFELFGDEKLLQSLNVRLIAADRPGMGLSDFQANRRLVDFPQDIATLADILELGRFSILAYSLGGPSGLACAYVNPPRLARVGIVSGAALFTQPELFQELNPGTRRYLNLPRENRLVARAFLTLISAATRLVPKVALANAASLLPEPDRAVFSNPEMQQGFIKMVREAFRQGTRGALHESLLAITDLGFQLSEIQMPIQLWHGEADANIPVSMARYAANVIPHCEAKFYPAEGHLSLFKKNIAGIISALAA